MYRVKDFTRRPLVRAKTSLFSTKVSNTLPRFATFYLKLSILDLQNKSQMWLVPEVFTAMWHFHSLLCYMFIFWSFVSLSLFECGKGEKYTMDNYCLSTLQVCWFCVKQIYSYFLLSAILKAPEYREIKSTTWKCYSVAFIMGFCYPRTQSEDVCITA